MANELYGDVAEQLALVHELRRIIALIFGDRQAYEDLEVDYGRPFPEELNGARHFDS